MSCYICCKPATGRVTVEKAQYDVDLDVKLREKDEEDPNTFPDVLIIQAISPALRERNGKLGDIKDW
jgi:hypothetical protein